MADGKWALVNGKWQMNKNAKVEVSGSSNPVPTEKPDKKIEELKNQINEKIAKEGLKKDIKIDLSSVINPTLGIKQQEKKETEATNEKSNEETKISPSESETNTSSLKENQKAELSITQTPPSAPPPPPPQTHNSNPVDQIEKNELNKRISNDDDNHGIVTPKYTKSVKFVEKSTVYKNKEWISNSNSEVPGKPIQLITQDSDGNFVVVKEALEILQGLHGNVAVCDVVGPYRSGKSFILNLILNRKEGFTLGKTQKSCTRGIWMWDTPIKHKNDHGEFNLILLDTEGLGSYDTKPELDNKIFVLSLLLSSFFIFNTKNVIDRTAIKQLGIMTDLSKFINTNYEIGQTDTKDDQRICLNSPDFVWTVRDFYLDLNEQTPKEYLNSCLEMETGQTRNEAEIIEVNFIRESIKKSFKSIDCFCLPFPIDSGCNGMSFEQTLRQLDQLEFEKLKPEFRTGIKILCDSIKRNICPKTVFTIPLSAVAFSKYVENVVQQLNQNTRVSLNETLNQSIKYASEKALRDAIENYKTKIQEFLDENPLPVKWELLDENEHKAMESSYKILQMSLNGSNELTKPVFESFNEEIYQYEKVGDELKLIGGILYECRLTNSMIIKAKNKKVLNKLWKEGIVEFFFDRPHDSDPHIAEKFVEAYELLKKTYCMKAFLLIEPEMSEAFNEWYKEKDIENIINNMEYLSEQVKQKLENEQKIKEMSAAGKRIERDFKVAVQKHEQSVGHINEKMKVMEAEHVNQVKELEEKLITAKAAAEAASKIAEQAKAEISAIQEKKTKESRCTIS